MKRLVFFISIVIILAESFLIINGLSTSGENPDQADNELQYYSITGRILPPNATMNTCCQGTVPFFDNATGDFKMDDLKNGEYRLAFASPGYETHLEIIQIDGSDVDLGTIQMLKEGEGPSYYIVSVGPWLDADGKGIAGIIVSYEKDGDSYWNITDDNGFAWIKGPVESIEDGASMTASFKTRKLIWKWNLDSPPYNVFITRKVESKESYRMLIIIIGVLLILLMAAVLFVRIFRGRDKGNLQ